MQISSSAKNNRVYITQGAGGAGGAGTTASGTLYIPDSPDIMRKKIIAYMAVSAWINSIVLMPIGSRFCNISFKDLDLEGAIFYSSSFLECSFKNTNLYRASFTNCEMLNCQFHNTYLVNACFNDCNILRCSFHLAYASYTIQTHFYNCSMDTKIFEANLDNSTLFTGSMIKNRVLADKPLAATFNRGDFIFRLICFKEGPSMIEAGCRWMTWKEYWRHTRTYDNSVKKARTRAILKLFKVYLQPCHLMKIYGVYT